MSRGTSISDVFPSGGALWLASGSPRRRAMLEARGVAVHVLPAGVDDGRLQRPAAIPVRWWVSALAFFKARWVANALNDEEAPRSGVVLAADTVCRADDRALGQPADERDAVAMLRTLRGRPHETVTGVCIIDRASDRRWFVVDSARVVYGDVSDAEIESYVASGAWRGKAGAYNLEERIAAGWPLSCSGDPDTVMGLPMRALGPWLDRFGAAS